MRVALLILIVGFVAGGCAGIVAPFVNNPYAGTYNGNFVANDGRTGPATFQLTNIGNVFGNLTDTATNQAGTLNGSMDTKGVFNGTAAFPGSSHAVSGTFSKSLTGITGTFNGTGGYSISVDVNKQ